VSHIEKWVYPEEQYVQIGALEPWKLMLDIHNAILYGFVEDRLPEPGRAIDIAEAEAHVEHMEAEWEREAQGRDPSGLWTGAPPLSAMPLNAKLYLHSVQCDERRKYEVQKPFPHMLSPDFFNWER
jgi:hypothetical protein